MSTYVSADLVDFDERNNLILKPDCDIMREYMRKGFKRVEIRLDDGRTISADQRKKIFALVRDIADWNGDIPDGLRKYMVWDFCELYDIEPFSLKTVDMTTAREFINYLIEFCFANDVPCMDLMLNRTDDISRYLYLCLEYRRCAICGKKADIHHCTGSTVGMGNDRKYIHNLGREAIALCREHHTLIEAKGDRFVFNKWHVYGIKLDEYLCKKLKLSI